MGTVVVSDLGRFNDKIAFVRTESGEQGFLLVHVQTLSWSDGTATTGVDFSLVLRNRSGVWSFSDRADPDDADAPAELASGRVDWYGRVLRVERWLEGAEATAVFSEHFA
ncbi:hypothetical protein [Longispora albida]|uniref:hypothetical protein n=1 Tax=Longispora albida TaxID=203523 RepID=UPI00037F3DC0|nr:hypothetical protein [Longispora albida]